MREILFRGKRVDNGEWVFGYPLIDTAPCTLKKKGRCKCHHDGSYSVIIAWVDDYHEYADFEVDPETVGQYTGLTDKNGKKIFVGDLLNGFLYPYLSDNAHNYFAEVVWFENSSAFGLVTHKHPQSAVRGISEGNADYMEEFDSSDWEVIGNIHDNPELLTEATP